jgi:hypothetical protein
VTSSIDVSRSTVGRDAQLDDAPRLTEIVRRQAHAAEAEGVKRRHETLGVVAARLDEHVEFLGEPRPSMKGERMPADDDRPNGLRVQAREQFFEVARSAVH